MKLRNIHSRLLAAALIALGATACSDEVQTPEVPADGDLVITLSAPYTLAATGEITSETTTEMAPDENECRINDLRLIAFPQGSGHIINTPLQLPATLTPATEIRQGGATKGTYRVYVIANTGDALAEVRTEDELKQQLLEYSASSMPQAGNLPMVAAPASDIEVKSSGANIHADLELAVVKVSLNIIFDHNDAKTQAAFGDYGLAVTSAKVKNISKKQTLVDAGFKVFADAFEASAAGSHYETYMRNPQNATVNDRDVIEGRADVIDAPAAKQSWCWTSTLYLPERYVTDNNAQAYVLIDGKIVGANAAVNAVNHYRVNLGHLVDNARQLPRNTYYEVVADVHSLGDVELDSYVSAKNWTTVGVEAAMRQTYLVVDKTKVEVASLSPAEIVYQSNAADVSCEVTYSVDSQPGVPVLVATHDKDAKTYTLKINPAISLDKLTEAELKGTVPVTFKANNISKIVEADYDISPYFDVDYVSHHLTYPEGLKNHCVARVNTNLGGVKFTWTEAMHISTVGVTKVQIQCEKVEDGVWDVKMIMPTGHAAEFTTTKHTFAIGPTLSKYYTQFKTDIDVTVHPAPTKYRIYMRAINDRVNGTWPEGDNGDFTGLLSENDVAGAAVTSNNWIDGWSDNNQMNGNRHRAYVYYQYGETGGTDQMPDDVWLFSSSFPGDEMTGDSQNPGWYYLDIPEGKTVNSNKAEGQRTIKPGETLIIFSCNGQTDKGYVRHRFTHHMDPGITLFNYDDLEGWYLYDPTSDPYYRYYDDKPEVEDVTYTIYYKGKVEGWWVKYGVCQSIVTAGQTPDQYTLYSKDVTSVSAGNGWYKNTFRLKAPKGEYDKAIRLNGITGEPVMFSGNSWTTGYYQDGKWYKGKPAGAN